MNDDAGYFSFRVHTAIVAADKGEAKAERVPPEGLGRERIGYYRVILLSIKKTIDADLLFFIAAFSVYF